MCVVRWDSGGKSRYSPMGRCGHIRAIRSNAYSPEFTL